jgi:hypothetical protein
MIAALHNRSRGVRKTTSGLPLTGTGAREGKPANRRRDNANIVPDTARRDRREFHSDLEACG